MDTGVCLRTVQSRFFGSRPRAAGRRAPGPRPRAAGRRAAGSGGTERRRHRAHVNEATLRYAGTTGSPVLLVHAFPETGRAFRRLIPCSPPATRSSPWTCAASATPTPRQTTTTARPARPGRQPGRAAWLRSGEGASRPRARARATISARVCVPSLAYRWEMWVLTVLCETYSSRAISRTDRLVGR